MWLWPQRSRALNQKEAATTASPFTARTAPTSPRCRPVRWKPASETRPRRYPVQLRIEVLDIARTGIG